MAKTVPAYQWYLSADLGEYAGKWVAIIDNKVVAKDDDLKKVLEKVREEYPDKEPFLTKIRKKGISVL